MDTKISTDARIAALITAALDGALSEEQAEQLAGVDGELGKLAWLAAAKRIAELIARTQGPPKIDPATPSGQRPIYTKPAAPKRGKKPGAKVGHAPARRPTPRRIDERKDHRLERCPCCGGQLQRCNRTRTRTIEDFLKNLRAVVTEHTIHRDYCPACKKHVEPVVPDAMPNAAIGHRAVALTSWLHYGLGLSISQTQELAFCQFRTHLSAGGLAAAWQRLAEVLEPWYIQIGEQARSSALLHADETGWRMNGKTWWLWCFANKATCYYLLGAMATPRMRCRYAILGALVGRPRGEALPVPHSDAFVPPDGGPHKQRRHGTRHTTRSPPSGRAAWLTCCGNWKKWTRPIPAPNGRHSPRSFAGWFGMESGFASERTSSRHATGG